MFRFLCSMLAVVFLWQMEPAIAQQGVVAADFAKSRAISAGVAANGMGMQRKRVLRQVLPSAVLLDEISSEKAAALSTVELGKQGAPKRIGLVRNVDAMGSSAKVGRSLQWTTLASGERVASISVTSPGAVGARLAVLIEKLPANTRVSFFSQKSDSEFVFSDAEVNNAISRNIKAQGDIPSAHVFWGPTVQGEEATVEFVVAKGASVDDLLVSVPMVSHLYVDPASSQPGQTKDSSCEVDVACRPEWSDVANATARMVFVEDGYAYVCSGTLLNDQAASSTPYFLSANHCISTQAAASTLETHWFYKVTSCGGSTTNPTYSVVPGGAELLYASASTDTSFLRLYGNPPAGAVYSGWTSAPATSTQVAALHYPGNQHEKISLGTVLNYGNCTDADGKKFLCQSSNREEGNFMEVGWSTGTTEGGSSGSGLFVSNSGGHLLVGQLYGGSTTCGGSGSDAYGRFDVAYSVALKNWLSASATVVPQSGWWWNPSEGGRGYFIEAKNGRFYVASFLYDIYGYPAWYVTGPDAITSNGLVGSLNSFSGGQSLTGVYRTPSGPVSVGTARISFTDPTHGNLSWPGGNVAITRYELAPGSLKAAKPAFQPESGWWWNASEGGRGFAIEVQGDNMYIGGFLYSENGAPVWYVSGGKMTSSSYYEGVWNQCANGQSMTGTYRLATCSAIPRGGVGIAFDSTTTATMRLPDGRSLRLTRFSF